MARPYRRFWVRAYAAAILAIVALCWFSPRLRAGCGDYPHPPAAAEAVKSAEASDSESQGVKPDLPKPCPCSGPQCSGRSSLPAVPPTAPPQVQNDLAALVPSTLCLSERQQKTALDQRLYIP